MSALDKAVRSCRALYAGISNYNAADATRAIAILKQLGTPCLIHQPKYSMFVRWIEDSLLDLLEAEGVGCIPFSPLAQGLLTNKYLQGIPEDSRAAKAHGYLQEKDITDARLSQIKQLNDLALERGQSLAQMALAWVLKDPRITSVLVGASKPQQLADSLACLNNLQFGESELQRIETILQG